ncbi:MAG: alpha/beta hydrolase [Janthinobacterium lividum]|uniref:alpha/beta hydrolase n=1 Tax=Pseudomonas sp. MWU16-30317 TaxID=2878095 RepID=UPI001CF95768|nr:alpha/beta fold hydrolase [Pseudomonas sp. MWU16-30317]
MPTPAAPIKRRRWLPWLLLALFIGVGLPYGCSQLVHKERELIFSIEPGNAGWFTGIPAGMQELDIPIDKTLSSNQYLHAWWWPARGSNAPTLLYLHGMRWNLTAQLGRITALHNMGFAVLAIDYRGFGQSPGDLPSERSVYQDAQAAWKRLVQLQPDAGKRMIYGHSLGGAIAIDLAEQIDKDDLPKASGLIIESTFTDMGAAAQAVIKTSLPVRWILSEKFDSIDKIADVGIPVLIVHGTEDQYIPPRLSEELFEAAMAPKKLLLIPGGTHNNSMIVGNRQYAEAIRQLFKVNADIGAG